MRGMEPEAIPWEYFVKAGLQDNRVQIVARMARGLWQYWDQSRGAWSVMPELAAAQWDRYLHEGEVTVDRVDTHSAARAVSWIERNRPQPATAAPSGTRT